MRSLAHAHRLLQPGDVHQRGLALGNQLVIIVQDLAADDSLEPLHRLDPALDAQRLVQRCRLLHLESGLRRRRRREELALGELGGGLVQHRLHSTAVRSGPVAAADGGTIAQPHGADERRPLLASGAAPIEVAQV